MMTVSYLHLLCTSWSLCVTVKQMPLFLEILLGYVIST